MKHYFHAEILPLIQGRVICEKCEKVVKIGDWPTGKRRSCPATKKRPSRGKRTYTYEQALSEGFARYKGCTY